MSTTRIEFGFLLALVCIGLAIGANSSTRNTVYIDEITYARLGYSLSQGHLASDSSFLSIYRSYGLVTNAIVTPYGYIDSVQPWLDHPPLVGYLLIPFVIAGVNLRSLPILFDIGIALLLYLSLRDKDRLAGGASAIVFLAYMAIFPVLTMLFLDSGVSFFFMLTVSTALYFERTKSTRALYASGVTAGLAALSKVPGVAAVLFLVLFLVYEALSKRAKPRQAFPSLAIAVGIASVWPIYGFLAEPGLFWQLTIANAARTSLSSNSLQQILITLDSSATFAKPDYALALSPVMLASWVAAAATAFRKKFRMFSLGLGSYLIVLFALRYAPPQMTVPLFPFLAVSIGAIFADAARLSFARLMSGKTSTSTDVKIGDRNEIQSEAISNVDRGGLEPPTSPSLDSFAKGLDEGSVSYQTRLPAHVSPSPVLP
jgi:4-amino-4-deoxy-L-arabinose transferase-like glycosyltransferase